jgi:hypothetical protein
MLEQMWAGPERKMCSGLRKQAWHPAALGGTRWDCRRDGLNPLLNPRSQKTTPLPGYLPGNGAEAAIVSTPTGSRSFAESSGDTAVEENSGPHSGPVGVASDVGDLVRLLADLPEDQRRALVSLMRHAAGG